MLPRRKACASYLQREAARPESRVGQGVEVESAQTEAHLSDRGRIKGRCGRIIFGSHHRHKLAEGNVDGLPVTCSTVEP